MCNWCFPEDLPSLFELAGVDADINSEEPRPDEELPWVDPAWGDIYDSYELYREQVGV